MKFSFAVLNNSINTGILRPGLVIVLLFLSSFASVGQTLRIAVAANAQFVTQALKNAFEKRNPVKIELIVSSSGKLTAQIEHGAPYDVFLSADMKYPETIYRSGNSLDKPQVYGYGKLVLWTVKGISFGNGLEVLKDRSVKTIAVANPSTAPYGVAAISALKEAGIYDVIKNKIVYGESIAQVNQYLLSGVADVVFTAKSVVESPALKNKGKWIEISDSLYQPIQQGAVILKYAERNDLKDAQAFYNFLFTSEGKAVFRSFGYEVR